MEKIYHRHENELNKWTNEYLDSIESQVDCKELVVMPVAGSIEFAESAVEEVVDYCGRNPFYMHLLCYALFQFCMREQKTYVDFTVVAEAQERIMRTSGESNFAHYWNDNPTLDEAEHGTLNAQTCLALAVISRLGGRFERIEECLDAQREMELNASERLSRLDVDRIIALLVKRRVLVRDSADCYEITPPILRHWLEREGETVSPAQVAVPSRGMSGARGIRGRDREQGSSRVETVVSRQRGRFAGDCATADILGETGGCCAPAQLAASVRR